MGGTPDVAASLVDSLAGDIQQRIMSGAIPFGSWLRQETLASEFGVSRTPVREALRKLEARGLVALVPQRGAVVRGPTTREIREAYQVRAELEGLAAELAAARIDDDELRRLREAEELFRRSVVRLAEAGDGRCAATTTTGSAPTRSSTTSSRRPRATSACVRPSPTSTVRSRGT